MVLRNAKLDITDRVVGKWQNGAIELFADNEPIGRIRLPQDESWLELKQGYEQQQDKIYKQVTITTGADQKYVDCDSESGWC